MVVCYERGGGISAKEGAERARRRRRRRWIYCRQPLFFSIGVKSARTRAARARSRTLARARTDTQTNTLSHARVSFASRVPDLQHAAHACTRTHRHADKHTPRHRDTETDADTQDHEKIQTDRRTDTHTQRHRDTETDADTDTDTDKQTDAQTHTHTWKGSDWYTSLARSCAGCNVTHDSDRGNETHDSDLGNVTHDSDCRSHPTNRSSCPSKRAARARAFGRARSVWAIADGVRVSNSTTGQILTTGQIRPLVEFRPRRSACEQREGRPTGRGP